MFQVQLRNKSSNVKLRQLSPSGEWDITNSKLESVNRLYGQDVYSKLVATICLKRKYTFYMVNIVVPCLLMSMLSLLGFCLPPEAGEKISLGITVLLSFTVFLLLVADTLPRTSTSVPLLGKSSS